jgi:multiple sugar transport system permease protein
MTPKRVGYWFVAPATLHLLGFALIPIGYALFLSFYDWDLLRAQRPFVGLKNYTDLGSDAAFWNAMWNSTRYAVVSVPLGMAVALGVAILVNQKIRGLAIFRTLYYLPAITSGVAISMLWIYVYLPKSGMINATLGMFGWPNETDFLNEVHWAMWALVFMSIWTGLGPRMVLFLAGLIGIPVSLYEAAELDGASRWRTFWSVTLPMLTPTTLFVLVTSTISAFQIFTPIYMMTRGGPLDSTDVVGYHIYVTAWKRFNVGEASAQSFVLLLVIAAVSWFQYRFMRDRLEAYRAE